MNPETSLYQEQVGYGWEQVASLIVVIGFILLLVFRIVVQSRSPSDVFPSILIIALMLGFAWIVRPKKMDLTITGSEIVYREGKAETHIAISDVSNAIPCAIRLKRRGGGVRMLPWPGSDSELVRSYETKLRAAPGRRRYSLHAGAAMAVLLTQGGVMLFSTKTPEKAIAALMGVLHKPT